MKVRATVRQDAYLNYEAVLEVPDGTSKEDIAVLALKGWQTETIEFEGPIETGFDHAECDESDIEVLPAEAIADDESSQVVS